MTQKLGDAIIRKEPAPAKGSKPLYDTEVKGFGCRIYAPTRRNPEGSRSFFLNYYADGIERRITIGEFPTWMTKDARAEAAELRKRVDKGDDPASEKRERREAPTVQDLIDRYIKDHLPNKACFGTWRERDERRMLEQIADGLGRARKVADIHTADIEKLHKAITVANGPIRANRVLACASMAFSLSLKPRAGELTPWRTAAQGNPCKGVPRNQETPCERFFSEEEIAAIADALNQADERAAADAIRLIMLTGCRPCEALQAKWSEFDEPGFWIKPSAHTKQKRVHKAPLGAAARELIGILRQARTDSPFLFPSKSRSGHIEHLKTGWRTVRRRATLLSWANSPNPAVSGLVADLTRQLGRQPTVEDIEGAATVAKITLPASLATARAYDLRHTFASLGAHMGLPVIGRLLGHTQARTTQRYVHIGDAAAREAAEHIGGIIGKAVTNARRRAASTATES